MSRKQYHRTSALSDAACMRTNRKPQPIANGAPNTGCGLVSHPTWERRALCSQRSLSEGPLTDTLSNCESKVKADLHRMRGGVLTDCERDATDSTGGDPVSA